MVFAPLEIRRYRESPLPAVLLAAVPLAAALLLAAASPSQATVATVYGCPSSGSGGNHDGVNNGFFVQNLNAVNLHTVVIDYTTDTDGTYTLQLTATDGTYAGPLIGTLTQMVSLSSGQDTPVTWSFGDAAFTPGHTVAFTHSFGGPGGVQFNVQPTLCPGDVETVGTSSNSNGLSVAVTITDNTQTATGCTPGSQTLCISDQPGDHRFQVTSTFATSQGGGQSGNGGAIDLTPVSVTEGGLFWFFGAANPEMLIKVLDGCGLNNHFWVFYAAVTNVGFHVTVKDTKTGHTATYVNPDLTAAAPVQDTSALTCP
ncbi:MAG TPA: hypothetical protein VE075_03685 [Thermoanaerobaculia bacterium]|nr:hypothetical protein [Thermoanaerobaculia bacterium]